MSDKYFNTNDLECCGNCQYSSYTYGLDKNNNKIWGFDCLMGHKPDNINRWCPDYYCDDLSISERAIE